MKIKKVLDAFTQSSTFFYFHLRSKNTSNPKGFEVFYAVLEIYFIYLSAERPVFLPVLSALHPLHLRYLRQTVFFLHF